MTLRRGASAAIVTPRPRRNSRTPSSLRSRRARSTVLWLTFNTAARSRAGGRRSPAAASSPKPAVPPAKSLTRSVPRIGLSGPYGLAVTGDGGLLISNRGSNQVLERAPDGTVQVFAGTGVAGSAGDGGLATQAQLNG